MVKPSITEPLPSPVTVKTGIEESKLQTTTLPPEIGLKVSRLFKIIFSV